MDASLTWVTPGTAWWMEYSDVVRCELSSTVLVRDGGLVFIDPIPLAPEQLEALCLVATPRAIILTNANHQRHSRPLAAQLGIPIHAPLLANDELDADIWFAAEGPPLPGDLTPVPLPGFPPGETALFDANQNLLIVGDALINIPERRFEMLPDKYCADPIVARRSLGILGTLKFETFLFAHGLPLQGSHTELVQLLASIPAK